MTNYSLAHVQNCTNNFTHPAIAQLCEQFYYSTPNQLGILFPKEFKDKVPEMAAALAATAVSSTLGSLAPGELIK